MPPDSALDVAIHVMLAEDDQLPRDASYFLAKALDACHQFIEVRSRERWSADMAGVAAKLLSDARRMLARYERLYPEYKQWADERHTTTWESRCRRPHRHFLFCLLTGRVDASLRQLVEDLDIRKDRFTVGLKSPTLKQLRDYVIVQLKSAGLSLPEIAKLLDPNGFAAGKDDATEAVRKHLKRAGGAINDGLFQRKRPRLSRAEIAQLLDD